MPKHYVNELGTDLILDTGVVLATVTEQHIKFKNPAGTTGSFAASLYNSYSELAVATGTYLLTHSLVSTDFTTPGEWRLQAYIASATGTWLGETVKLQIFDNYE